MTRKAEALAHFKRMDLHFYTATLAQHSFLPLELPQKRTTKALFESLASIVVSQQLATKAADSIFTRLKEVSKGSITSLSILRIKSEKLRAAGLSAAKVKTLKSIAQSVEDGSLDLLSLKKIPEIEAAEKLMSIWGLGPWSVEMFLMFGLGRTDVFSVGDLGLIRSIESLYDLPKGVPRETLLSISQKWAPYRTFASLLLWRNRDATLKIKK